MTPLGSLKLLILLAVGTCALFPLGVIAQAPGMPDDGMTISGRVLDADSGAPVAGASVRAEALGAPATRPRDAPVTTDADGRYVLTDLPPGPVRVWVSGSTEYLNISMVAPRMVAGASGRIGGWVRP